MAQAMETVALIDALWPGRDGQRWLRNVILVVAGSAALTVSAHIQIPMWPVPMTLQPFAVLLIAMVFGWFEASPKVAAYVGRLRERPAYRETHAGFIEADFQMRPG